MIKNILRNFLYLAVIFFSFSIPASAFAQATLSISPASGDYKVGDSFSVLVNLDSGGKDINVASAKINFDNTKLQVQDLGYSRSIFTIWTQEPQFSNPAGIISFSGGLPSPGFNGPSGAILRITFTTKAAGKAQVIFSTGYVLANDGSGTNILQALNGATFNIGGSATQSVSPTPQTVEKPVPSLPSYVTVPQPIAAPLLVAENSKQIEEGDLITVSGLALPSTKVILYIQKDYDEHSSEEDFSGPDGKFIHTYSKKTTAGIYRVWGKNVSSDGVTSDASEPIVISVVQPMFFRFGSLVISYLSIILGLISILMLVTITIIYWWIVIRKKQKEQGVEISEAESALHEGFDKLRAGFEKYVDYKGRKTRVKKEMKESIETIEKDIEKEIEDINKTNK